MEQANFKETRMRKVYTIGLLMVLACWSQAQSLERVINLRGYWKFSIGDHKEWATTEYDDSDWEEIYAPRRWEREGFNGYDGYAWYRTSFDGKDLKNEKTLYLKLGYIDDVDEVFINGKKIGFSGGFPPDYYTAYHAERMYRIPEDVINYNGKNLIAVRVFDIGGEGGIYTGDVGIFAPEAWARDAVYLEGLWSIRIGDRREYADPEYNHEKWENIMVPSNWKSIGINDLRDFAWYRRNFEVSSDGKTKGMTLICGKIDDFDEVYINGEKIGSTKDGRRLGASQSYQKLRIYPIPSNVLKTGKNTIAIRVEDIGNEGGIYEGPVVIVPDAEVSRMIREQRWSFWR